MTVAPIPEVGAVQGWLVLFGEKYQHRALMSDRGHALDYAASSHGVVYPLIVDPHSLPAGIVDAAKAIIGPDLRRSEGERLSPYLCPAGVPTIGVGCTTYADGRPVKMTDPPITPEQSSALLDHHVGEGIARVLTMVEQRCTAHQLAGMVECGFNIGWQALAGSSIIRLHRAGDYAGAARAFLLWCKYRPTPGGPLVEYPPLLARRMRESAVYATPDEDVPPVQPQEVEPPQALLESKRVRTGAVASAAGAAGILGQLQDQIETIRAPIAAARGFLSDTLGISASWVLPAALAAVGLFLVWHWIQDHHYGGV